MKISKLSEGMTFKNYKELCLFLDAPVKTGNAKLVQMNELSRYCTFNKQGQKIAIIEIFAEPLPKIDLRSEGNNSKYVEHIQAQILHTLSKTEGHKYTITKNNLFESLGMVNTMYLDKALVLKLLPKKDSRFTKFNINHLYLRVNDRFTRILFDSLNSLENRCLLDYNELYMVVRIDEDGIEHHLKATDLEKVLITDIKYKVLQDMKLNSVMQVMFKFKTDEFYRRVNKKLKEYDIDYAYKQIELLFEKNNVLYELSKMELQQHKKNLNDKVIETMTINTRDTFYKNEKEYEEGLIDFLLNEKPAFGKYTEMQFKGFKHNPDYIDIQLELIEYILRI